MPGSLVSSASYSRQTFVLKSFAAVLPVPSAKTAITLAIGSSVTPRVEPDHQLQHEAQSTQKRCGDTDGGAGFASSHRSAGFGHWTAASRYTAAAVRLAPRQR